MTWLSRLLPQSNRLHLVSIPKSRTPNTKRHRRMATLETLEHRVVMSNVSTSLVGSALTISADKFNNAFAITETRMADGTHVTVTATDKVTNINGIPYFGGIEPSWTSPSAVGSIKVNDAGGANVISLTGEGKSALETTGAVTFTLTGTTTANPTTLSVSNIDNPGAFNLTSNQQLSLSIDSSTWNSININQSGCCPANVSLTNDKAGAVSVKEGWGNGSSIFLADDTFGATTLVQQNGTQPTGKPNCDGNNDTIDVLSSFVTSLSISQLATGQTADGKAPLAANNSVTVDTVHLTPGTSTLGLKITQGNGNGDTADVTNVTVDNGNPNLRAAPCTSIVITQGNGTADSASVTASTVPGDILVTQGNGKADTASVDTSHAGTPKGFECGNIFVTQGDGELDDASVTNSTATLNIAITQGAAIPTGDPKKDQHGPDTAEISNSTAGFRGLDKKGNEIWTAGDVSITQNDTAASNPGNSALIDTVDAGGDISIDQGGGAGDTATVTNSNAGLASDSGGGIFITQGDGKGDSADVDNSTASGDVEVSQGNGAGDTAMVDTVTSGGSVFVTQGNGDGDTATVQGSTVTVDINVSQGNGNGDTVNILGVTAGSVDDSGGFPLDVDGNVTVVQGNGYNDIVNVDQFNGQDNIINNLSVTQGNNVPFTGCEPGLGDEVHVNDSQITSDITIRQGTEPVTLPNGTVVPGAFGYYLVTIGDTSPVTAGGVTSIVQAGEGNTVILGGANAGGFDFTTTWMDIFTGLGGGAFVDAANTQVLLGSFLGNDFTIDGGGDGNTFVDEGGNDGVTVSGNFNV
jgi:hypothetical protein